MLHTYPRDIIEWFDTIETPIANMSSKLRTALWITFIVSFLKTFIRNWPPMSIEYYLSNQTQWKSSPWNTFRTCRISEIFKIAFSVVSAIFLPWGISFWMDDFDIRFTLDLRVLITSRQYVVHGVWIPLLIPRHFSKVPLHVQRIISFFTIVKFGINCFLKYHSV